MKKITFITGLLIVSFSCKQKVEYVINLKEYVINDSTLLYKTVLSKNIHVGDSITHFPLVSQLYDKNEIVEYIILDKNKLHFFDYNTGSLKKTHYINSSSTTGCGVLNNYSGFYYHSPDSIFIYNYKLKYVFLIDSLSNIKKKWNVIDKNLAKYPVDPEALTASPLIFTEGIIILSGSALGQPKDASETNKPISCLINTNNDSIKYEGCFPEQYRKENFGGVYLNSIYHSKGKDNSIIYSFPIDHYLYLYNDDYSNENKIYAGSRNIKMITSSSMSSIDIFVNKNEGIKYYVGQPSYKNILYDRYRDLYYRIATIPLSGWKESDKTFKKPFSILILNGQRALISETPIIENYNELNLDNMHISPEGLIIQRITNDENILNFEIYKIIDL
jgi:hypothetical protein